jgi:hypothetical protein
MQSKSPESTITEFATIALLGLALVAAFVPPLQQIAIVLGAIVWPGVGYGLALIMALASLGGFVSTARKSTTAILVDCTTAILIAVVVVAGITGIDALKQIAITLGAVLLPGVGALFAVGTLALRLAGSFGQGSTLANFSSLAPSDEQPFAVHERAQRTNAAQAMRVGLGVAATVGIAIVAVVLTQTTLRSH